MRFYSKRIILSGFTVFHQAYSGKHKVITRNFSVPLSQNFSPFIVVLTTPPGKKTERSLPAIPVDEKAAISFNTLIFI